MILDSAIINRLNQILTKIRNGTETANERQLLVKILDMATPEEMNLFIQRHNFQSVDTLKKYIKEKDDKELLGGLLIMGVGLLTLYLISKDKK